jgi:hypothetical protein
MVSSGSGRSPPWCQTPGTAPAALSRGEGGFPGALWTTSSVGITFPASSSASPPPRPPVASPRLGVHASSGIRLPCVRLRFPALHVRVLRLRLVPTTSPGVPTGRCTSAGSPPGISSDSASWGEGQGQAVSKKMMNPHPLPIQNTHSGK